MKLTIMTRELDVSKNHWEIQRLVNLLTEKQIDFSLQRISNLFGVNGELDQLGTHIFQWNSDLIKPVQHATFLELIKDKIIINGSRPGKHQSRHKSYQQLMVSQYTNVATIPTYMIREPNEVNELIEKGLLTYPFIQKPNYGSKGKGVILVHKQSDLTLLGDQLYKTILQPYIKNDGDFRILIVGGEVIGVIKRKGAEGSIVNNYSQGGSVTQVTDKQVVSVLSEMALQVAQVFEYDFCGVDMMYDASNGAYVFMEVNALPGWKGFHEATGICVEEKIVEKYLK